MQTTNGLFNNQANISGRIASEFIWSHEVYGEGFYNFTIEIPRLSDAVDLIPATVSERLIDKDRLPVGTYVVISGQIRSYNNFVAADQKNKLMLTLFVRELATEPNGPPSGGKSPNEVFLNGYICRSPVYRTTPLGREIADILIAVNRSYNKSDYIPCIAWGRNARFAEKLAVSDNIMLWGRMQSRKYQKRLETGEVLEKTAYEISISKIEQGGKDTAAKDEASPQKAGGVLKGNAVDTEVQK
ncbi:MAG: single-stranded DNA-binding protein [Clostridiales bacterium]|jgi:single-stranded DNA-binding protein|nr:single-stranded DNA-binding protein [Clostridiales bacterium]